MADTVNFIGCLTNYWFSLHIWYRLAFSYSLSVSFYFLSFVIHGFLSFFLFNNLSMVILYLSLTLSFLFHRSFLLFFRSDVFHSFSFSAFIFLFFYIFHSFSFYWEFRSFIFSFFLTEALLAPIFKRKEQRLWKTIHHQQGDSIVFEAHRI